MSPVSHREAKTKQITVTIERARRRYPFALCSRLLKLGPDATIQYYWMDSTEFRNLGSKQHVSNYFNCLQHWWESIQLQGNNDDLDQQIHYVLAQAHPIFCKSKSVQDNYRDAYLHMESVPNDVAKCLPDEDRERIGEIVRSQDRDRVKAELDMALGRHTPPECIMPALREALRRWAGNGVVLWRRNGTEGLKQWLNEVEYWAEKYRHRRGVSPLVRHFVSMFAYEAKISFYTCYANAWIDILPELRKRHGLDLVSERFMRVWHNQNQAVEIRHGQTRHGVYYPTGIRYDIMVPDPRGRLEPRRISVPTERIGPTHLPDVFSGQVLSLHPLSGFFMKDPSLCAVAGRLFASPRFDQVMANGLSEYWEFVGAVLTAASLYRRASEYQENHRGVYQRGDVAEESSGSGDSTSAPMLLEDFAIAQKIDCPQCHVPVCYRDCQVTDGGRRVCLEFECPKCRHAVTRTVDSSTLKKWLTD
jgi:hypothetical protein